MIERYEDMKARNWYVMSVVNAILDTAIRRGFVKGENAVYFSAAMRLAAKDTEGFARNGFDFGSVRYYGHERKGKKLVAVKARWLA